MRVRPLLLASLIFCGGCAWIATVCAGPPRAAAPPVILTVDGDRLTVQLDRVRLQLVMSALAKQAGIRIELPVAAGHALVSAAFADLPLEQGIARLLDGHSYLLTYADAAPIPGAPKPLLELWVISRGPTRESATGLQTTGEGRAEGAAAMRDPDPQFRLQALERWAQSRQVISRDERSMDPVTHALVDADEGVRARAQELFDQALTDQAAQASASTSQGARR